MIALVAVALVAGGLTMVFVQSHARRQIAEAQRRINAVKARQSQIDLFDQ